MTQDLSLISQWISRKDSHQAQANAVCVLSGILALALLAQVSISLPWTPVPITGQTFGVALMSLLWGRKRGLSVMLGYLLFGSMGLPIFAHAGSGFPFGPTAGYLFGMVLASYVVGSLADKGWNRSFLKTWLAATLGSLIIFSCGLIVLSYFVPAPLLLAQGFLPFLPGDVLKTFTASAIAYRCHRSLELK